MSKEYRDIRKDLKRGQWTDISGEVPSEEEGSSSDLKLQMESVVTEVPQTSPLLVWRASGRETVPRMRSEVAACPLQHAEYDKRDNRDNLGTMQMMLATICSSAGQSG